MASKSYVRIIYHMLKIFENRKSSPNLAVDSLERALLLMGECALNLPEAYLKYEGAWALRIHNGIREMSFITGNRTAREYHELAESSLIAIAETAKEGLGFNKKVF